MAEVSDLHPPPIANVAAESRRDEALYPTTLLRRSSAVSGDHPLPSDLIQFGHDSVEYPDFHTSLDLDLFDHSRPLPGRLDLHLPPISPNFMDFDMADEICAEDGGDGDIRVVSDWGAEGFFLSRRNSVSESIEFDSESDSDEQIVAIGADLVDSSQTPGRIMDPVDDEWRDPNEEFEWEEVDAQFDDREVLGGDDNDQSGITRNNIDWEVLLAVNHLGRNSMDPEDVESYFAEDREGFVYTSEYEILVGQFTDHDSSLKPGPPAAKLVVENLPSLVLTKEDISDNNIVCVVCKDQVSIEETVKTLPCTHRYHQECILPWLRIRNTCPLCRFELPTDDPEYERWKAQRAGGVVSQEESEVRYGFEILPETYVL